jgi:hypothetical protein
VAATTSIQALSKSTLDRYGIPQPRPTSYDLDPDEITTYRTISPSVLQTSLNKDLENLNLNFNSLRYLQSQLSKAKLTVSEARQHADDVIARYNASSNTGMTSPQIQASVSKAQTKVIDAENYVRSLQGEIASRETIWKVKRKEVLLQFSLKCILEQLDARDKYDRDMILRRDACRRGLGVRMARLNVIEEDPEEDEAVEDKDQAEGSVEHGDGITMEGERVVEDSGVASRREGRGRGRGRGRDRCYEGK